MSDTKTPPTRFREMLKLYRESTGLSYRHIAALTGLEHSVIWRFEEGRPVKENAFARLVSWIMENHDPVLDRERLEKEFEFTDFKFMNIAKRKFEEAKLEK
jgi:transcriptional regulator with XRE-family HTH domain